MIEARKCVRCGAMYVSDTEVCGRCQQKDGADLYKLKGYFEKEFGAIGSEREISQATGISQKNLERFLGYDEFKGIEFGNVLEVLDEEVGTTVEDDGVTV